MASPVIILTPFRTRQSKGSPLAGLCAAGLNPIQSELWLIWPFGPHDMLPEFVFIFCPILKAYNFVWEKWKAPFTVPLLFFFVCLHADTQTRKTRKTRKTHNNKKKTNTVNTSTQCNLRHRRVSMLSEHVALLISTQEAWDRSATELRMMVRRDPPLCNNIEKMMNPSLEKVTFLATFFWRWLFLLPFSEGDFSCYLFLKMTFLVAFFWYWLC